MDPDTDTTKVPFEINFWTNIWPTLTATQTPSQESEKAKTVVHKYYDSRIMTGDLLEDIRIQFPEAQIKPIKVRIGYGQGNEIEFSSSLTQKELNNAFRAYNMDTTTKISLKVEVTTWPTFPNPFMVGSYGDGSTPKTLSELNMMKFSACIRRKPFWYQKMDDQKIFAKWSKEAQAEGCTEKQISYVRDELKYYDSLRDPEYGIEVSDIDGIYHSDILIDRNLKEEFKVGVAKLEDIPEEQRDWHPGSTQVWDLFHPSVYPLTYGKTRIMAPGKAALPSLKFCGGGEVSEIPENLDNNYSTSNAFCWLPSEFSIQDDGSVNIDSYINNLHPLHHGGLYRSLEKIFAKFVPLFDRVINDQLHLRNNRITICDGGLWVNREYNGPSDDEDYDEKYEEWNENRTLIVPDPSEPFVAPPAIENKHSLLGSQLQVIVKMASIILTPDDPKYSGGVWHVEGMLNENIVATGIYYYDINNITESELGFRQNIREPYYEQDDIRGVYGVYGLSNEDPLNQNLGSVLTKENRCIAFPNMYQHRVRPFKLTDPTKPGHRKILVFFLVNPGVRIRSSLTVPPQQRDWFIEDILRMPPFVLPSEVFDYLFEWVDWPVTLDKAKQWRQELMVERKYFISKNNDELFERPFSLCEH